MKKQQQIYDCCGGRRPTMPNSNKNIIGAVLGTASIASTLIGCSGATPDLVSTEGCYAVEVESLASRTRTAADESRAGFSRMGLKVQNLGNDAYSSRFVKDSVNSEVLLNGRLSDAPVEQILAMAPIYVKDLIEDCQDLLFQGIHLNERQGYDFKLVDGVAFIGGINKDVMRRDIIHNKSFEEAKNNLRGELQRFFTSKLRNDFTDECPLGKFLQSMEGRTFKKVLKDEYLVKGEEMFTNAFKGGCGMTEEPKGKELSKCSKINVEECLLSLVFDFKKICKEGKKIQQLKSLVLGKNGLKIHGLLEEGEDIPGGNKLLAKAFLNTMPKNSVVDYKCAGILMVMLLGDKQTGEELISYGNSFGYECERNPGQKLFVYNPEIKIIFEER